MRDNQTDEEIEIPVRTAHYENKSSSSIRLIIEPWADEYEVAPGQIVELIIEEHGPQEGPYLYFWSYDDCVVIHGGARQVIYAMSNGEELKPELEPRPSGNNV